MSNELDKLAAEMRKIKSSKQSRKNAMEAAMSAFGQEFAPEAKAAELNSSAENSIENKNLENNLDSAQGLVDDPRPTGQTTRETRVQTFGRQTMSKFNQLINFKPQTMMMAGSCAAALMAGLIILPNMGELGITDGAVETQTIEASVEVATAEAKVAPDVEVMAEVNSDKVDRTESRLAEVERYQDEKLEASSKPVIKKTQPEVGGSQKPVSRIEAEVHKEGQSKIQGEAVVSEEQTPSIAGPKTITRTRRAVKTPARTVERSIPAKTSTITRRVVKTPASTSERSVPAVTKVETRRVQNEDGTFETVTETIVVQEASTELVSIPPVFENVQETVVVQEASTELVTIPATFDTISETVQINADGTETVIASDVTQAAAAPEAFPAPTPQGGIGSVNSLLNDVRQNAAQVESENSARVQTFRQRANQPSAEFGFSSGFSGGDVTLPNASSNSGETSQVQKYGELTVEVAPPEFITKTETIVIQPASVEYVSIKPTYATVNETVVVQEASTELVTIPGEYEWVDGDIEGSAVVLERKPAEYEMVKETVIVQAASVEYIQPPAVYETVKDTIVVQDGYRAADGTVVPPVTEEISRQVLKQPASTQERQIPAVTKEVMRRVVKTPATTVEKRVPYEKKNGKTRVLVKPAAVVERSIPAVTKTEARRVIKTPARTTERIIPAVTKEVQVRRIAGPSKIYLRDDDGNVVREFASRDAFEFYKSNVPTSAAETPVSTFSVDVDTSSYSFLRASVQRGQLPPRSAIRLEEMINYFPYDYEAPTSADEPFKANVTVTPTPWNTDTKLMHIGIKGYVPTEVEKPRNNLVFLIDTSGSMNRQNKLPLLINSFKLLLNTLDKDDTVSIVAYASASGTVLEPTEVRNKSEIIAALNNLRASGSTAGAAGLELAYKNAEANFDDEGNNRVILATDGDFNVGFSSPDDMKTFITEKRDKGISLSVLGFGMGNYNDHLMQSLAQNGNGVAAYIDSLAEAQKVLANEAGSSLLTIAKDVKIQVEFNPATVAEYRLIGYETRALKRQDFNNDKVDAGDIGAGHSVTAIYEMTPVGSPAISVDTLRYVADQPKTDTGSDEYAFVKIRHKLPNATTSTLQTFPVGPRRETSLKRASKDMRFAAAVSIVGQKLRGDVQVEDYSYEDAIKLAVKAKGDDEHGYRAEFIRMVRLIDGLGE